jgi:hypothetical protein
LESLSGGTFVNPLSIATATNPPLTLARTENDTTERTIQQLRSGSGAGVKAEWRIIGDAANGVAQVALFVGAVEMFRTNSSRQVITPQGYLTLSSTLFVPTADVVAATSVWYLPDKGNMVPLVAANGLVYNKTFAALQLTLNNPNHVADTIYDAFVWDNAGTVVVMTGPAWTNSAVGTGARGTGAGTTELARVNGVLVNNVAMTGRNGATTFTVPAQTATYVGSFLIDSTVAQITAHRSFGQSRKWTIWNAYNQRRQFLRAGDPNATWQYLINAIRPSRADTTNSMVILTGLPDHMLDLTFTQNISTTSNNGGNSNNIIGIGYNSVAAFSGKTGRAGIPSEAEDIGQISSALARHLAVPAIGLNRVTCLEQTPTANGSVDPFGTEADMLLLASWMG